MSNCINCSFSLELNVKFCPECGTKQPETSNEKKDTSYSASIGDKNVISGNIIGKSEEFNITGPATINKIEDETKKFITCAVSGKHLLRGRDIVVNCPNCKSDVSQESFNLSASRCLNCDNKAYLEYSNKLDMILSDGIIDALERIELDIFALNLKLENTTKYKLETEAKDRNAIANLNAISSKNNELSGFYKIQFKKAISLIFEVQDLSGALSILSSIHKENIFHDETAYLYFLIKAIHTPTEYINVYDSIDNRSTDIYWEDYWAFIPYIQLGNLDAGFKIINLNKARFSKNYNDIIFSEVIAYILLFIKSGENDYYTEAKDVYSSIGRDIKKPLFQFDDLLNKLLNNLKSEWDIISTDFNLQEIFFYCHVLGGKLLNIDLTPQNLVIDSTISTNTNDSIHNNSLSTEPKLILNVVKDNFEVDADGNCWIDKTLGLRARKNRLYFVDSKSDIEYPTLLTNKVIWIAKNLELKGWWNKVFKEGSRNSIQDFLPNNWYLPSNFDWCLLSSFIALKNGNSQLYNSSAILINDEKCYVGDKLICIDAGNSSTIKNDFEYLIVNHDNKNIFLYDITNEKYLCQPGSTKLVPLGLKRFRLSERWKPSFYAASIIEQDYSYIHPTYPIANKFGIDYAKTGYITKSSSKNVNYSLVENYSRLMITKNEGVKLKSLLEITPNESPIRMFTTYTSEIIDKLVSLNFKLPEYLIFDELNVVNTDEFSKNSSLIQENKKDNIKTKTNFNELKISTKIFYNTRKFNSGNQIPMASNFDEWLDYCEQGKPVMCFYQFNSQNHTLYNFYAISSEEGIVPPGYRFPRTEDEDMLRDNYFAKGDFEPGVLEVGLDPSLGINRKRFKNKIAVWQAIDQQIVMEWDEIGVVPIGGYVFEFNNENELEQINVNGYYGFPILLISEMN